MEFRAFASSSGGNLYLVTEEGCRPLMIEAGLPMKAIRRALPISVTALGGCLISHNHDDHSHSVADLMRASVDVYASAGCWDALGLIGGHRAVAVKPDVEFLVGRWRVLPFDLRHDAEGCLGYLVGAPSGERLLFAIDTAYVPYRFDGLTLIAIECNYSAELLYASGASGDHKARILRSHLSLERVITMLESNDLSRVREIHLLHLSDGHSDAPAFKAAVEAATGKPTHCAPRLP